MIFFFQAEDGIRDLVRSRGLGDVYKRQAFIFTTSKVSGYRKFLEEHNIIPNKINTLEEFKTCLLYTSDAADERSSVDLGGRRIIKKKKQYIDDHTRQDKKRNNISHNVERT